MSRLVLTGLWILLLFAGAFVGLVYYLRAGGDGAGEVFRAVAPYWIFPYLAVTSVYAGFLAARFARGRWKHAWLWGIAGCAFTFLSTISVPRLLSPLFPYQGPEIFQGPAPLAFLAPGLSALSIVLLISIRRKATV